MKTCVLFIVLCCVLALVNGHLRFRRDVAGSLDIVTNNVQPIHAEVKPENAAVTEKVIPPSSSAVFQQSLRKSLPVTTKLDLVRSINRLLAMLVLLVTAAIEFYPILAQLFFSIYNFMIE